jgi:formylglycine-generating enzyme
MSESDDPPRPDSPRKTGQPMPRLWKAAPDPVEEDSKGSKKSRKDGDTDTSKSSSKSQTTSAKGKAKSAKGKGSSAVDDKSEKKVLLEDTPKLDTYESRRRTRLILGTLSTACVLLAGWIFYRAFLYEPLGFDTTAAADTSASLSDAEARLSLDQEARFMYNKAQEFAKNDQTDQALAMLNRVVKVYKGTSTANDSLAALDRASKKLPLFPGVPLVVAQPEEGKAPTAPPPPAVVNATPSQPQPANGKAALVLPVNPAEVVVVGPGSSANVASSKAAIAQRTLPSGFQANPDMGTHESGWPLVIVGDRDGSPMVLVPGGTFTMGSNEGQSAETPAHPVKLSTYYIDQHEVTNRQFRIFLTESHYRGTPPGKWLTDDKALAEPESTLPVVNVNFQDADSFAIWASKEIPTEAQWEMAARSADGRRYPWGDEPAKWSKARVYRQNDPVMTFPEDRSPYGVFDMAGNAQEWTRDWYDPKYYHLLTKTTVENPAGPPPSTRTRSPQRVVRGAAKNWSVTYREGVPHDRRLPYLGFRCVLTVEAPGPAPVTGNPATAPAAQPGAKPSTPTIPF